MKQPVSILSMVMLILVSSMAWAVPTKEVSISSELATPVMAAGVKQTAFVRIALTGFHMDNDVDRTPANVAIVLDKSGSMSGEKIRHAREAAAMAVGKLSDKDIVSIVTYDTTVDVVVPATRAGNRRAIYRAIDSIRSGGNTALFAGVSKGAYEVRKYIDRNRVNRVILLSDGLANVGPSQPSELGSLGMALAKDGITVTTIGLGLGYNEDLMTQLANYSDGNHMFVEDAEELTRVFEQEFGSVLSVIAQDVDIQIECDEWVKPLRIVGRDGDIIGRKVITRMNQLYSDEQKYVVLEVEILPQKSGAERKLADVKVAYHNMATDKQRDVTDSVVASFSDSEEKVRKAVNKPAYEAAVEQVANEISREALELRDRGDVDGARLKLQENVQLLESGASSIDSEKLRAQKREAEIDADKFNDGRDWNRVRKELKAKQYNRAKQNSVASPKK